MKDFIDTYQPLLYDFYVYTYEYFDISQNTYGYEFSIYFSDAFEFSLYF